MLVYSKNRIEKVGQKYYILELSFSIFPELARFELKQTVFLVIDNISDLDIFLIQTNDNSIDFLTVFTATTINARHIQIIF